MPDFDVVESYHRGGRAEEEFDLPRFQPRSTQREIVAASTVASSSGRPHAYQNSSSSSTVNNILGPPPSLSSSTLYHHSAYVPLPPPPVHSTYSPPGGMGSSVSHSSYQMSQRQPSHRLSQILDPDVLPSTTSSWSTSTLGRSASLAGMARARHGNQLPPDDVESAFVDLHSNGGDGNTRTAAQQSPPSQQSFYNSSITYQPSNVSTNESHRPPLSEQQSYSLRRSTTGMMSQSQQQPSAYEDGSYMSTTPSNYDAYSSNRNMDTTSPQAHPSSASPSSNVQGSISSQLPPPQHPSYYPSHNPNPNVGSNAASVYRTPPKRSDALLPTIPISSALPDTSHTLRSYALGSSSQQQTPQQYRGTTSATSPFSYPSRRQSPQTQHLSQSQSQYYSNTRGGDDGSSRAAGVGSPMDVMGGGRPMSIDGRPPSMAPPAPPLVPPPMQGFRRVRGPEDLDPRFNSQPGERRADPSGSGSFLSPLKCLTTNLAQTYNICNPQFRYETAHNPRRVLTKPSKPVHNDGHDNEDYDYILYVNDCLGAEEGQNKYLILDVLGQGTFGQVVKCQNMKTHEIVAVKVVKNKPAYFNQSMMEVTILELLNNTWDVHDEHHILRLRDTFIHKSHLCLVFELLSSNLYELIKQNSFGGLSTQLVKVFTAQLLDALTILNEAKLIHCDLKPENILLKSLQSPQIKVIDFGSACHERQTVYTYIQSRFYRSPEVLLGLSYNSAIDMWSLGCIAVELFLGLPLFPGTSEYNQTTRIVEMLGMPPTFMLDMGKQTSNFFTSYIDDFGRKRYKLKSLEQYSREHGTNEQPGKKYFNATTLPEIIRTAPQPKSASKTADLEKEAANRAAFIDFVQGLLNLNPIERWSPQQARLHPFITGEKFTRPYVPAEILAARASAQAQVQQSGNGPNPKQPYGGLVPTQPKGTRAYTDAASYNQHLNQHQSYTAQAASQAATQAIRNPYVTNQQSSQQPPSQALPTQVYENRNEYSASNVSELPQHNQSTLRHQASTGVLGSQSYSQGAPNAQQSQTQYPSSGLSGTIPKTNAVNNSYYPPRARANTINQSDHAIPPALARIANMGMDVSGIKRNTLTPVLNREEAIREWERRASGQRPPAGPVYPQLEYLQQQAELAASNWNGVGSTTGSNSRRYQPSNLSHFQSPPSAVTIDSSSSKHHREQSMTTGGMRDINMGSLTRPNTGSGYDQLLGQTSSTHLANLPPAPPQAYTTGSSARYGASTATSQLPPTSSPYQPSPFDTFDQRDGLGTLYTPMQPNLLSSSTSTSQQTPYSPNSNSNGGSGGLPNPSSFYGGGIVVTGSQQRRAPQQQTMNSPTASHQSDMWSR